MRATSMLKRAFLRGILLHGVILMGVCSKWEAPRMALGVSNGLPEIMGDFLGGKAVLISWVNLGSFLGAGVSRAASPASLMKLSPKVSGGSHPDTSPSAPSAPDSKALAASCLATTDLAASVDSFRNSLKLCEALSTI